MTSASSPLPDLGIGGGVSLFGVAEGGLDAAMAETFSDGGQADAVVDEVCGVGVAELVDCAGDAGGIAVPGPSRLGGLVTQRAASAVLLGAEQRAVAVPGVAEVGAHGGDEPVVVEEHGALPAAFAPDQEVFVVGGGPVTGRVTDDRF